MIIANTMNGMSEGSQQRDSVKDKVYKRPVSVLVVIYAQDSKRVLMLANIWPTSGLMRQLRRRSLSHGATGRRLKNL